MFFSVPAFSVPACAVPACAVLACAVLAYRRALWGIAIAALLIVPGSNAWADDHYPRTPTGDADWCMLINDPVLSTIVDGALTRPVMERTRREAAAVFLRNAAIQCETSQSYALAALSKKAGFDPSKPQLHTAPPSAPMDTELMEATAQLALKVGGELTQAQAERKLSALLALIMVKYGIEAEKAALLAAEWAGTTLSVFITLATPSRLGEDSLTRGSHFYDVGREERDALLAELAVARAKRAALPGPRIEKIPSAPPSQPAAPAPQPTSSGPPTEPKDFDFGRGGADRIRDRVDPPARSPEPKHEPVRAEPRAKDAPKAAEPKREPSRPEPKAPEIRVSEPRHPVTERARDGGSDRGGGNSSGGGRGGPTRDGPSGDRHRRG